MAHRQLSPDKYLSKAETRRLRQRTEEKALVDIAKGRTTWDKVWMLIDLVTNTGMRVGELTKLKIQDIHLGHEPYIHVVIGKGGKERNILIDRDNTTLKKHLKEYIDRYRLSDDDYLLNVNGRHYTTMGLQQQFKKAIREAELSEHYSIHSARHSYATYLYEKKKDLRLVQKQLGHASLNTTAIYADVTKEETYEALNGLYEEDEI